MHTHDLHAVSRVARLISAICAIALFWPGSASADYFLKFDGISGESADQRHRDWIDIDSFSWSITNTGSATGGGSGTGRSVFSDFSWTQGLDSSITGLFSSISGGTFLRNPVIDFTNSSGATYFRMTFDNALLTNLSLTGSGGVRPSLAGSFDYGLVRLDYWATDPHGGLGSHTWAEYNLRTRTGSISALAGVYAMGLTESSTPPIPEPETYAMLLAGLGLVGVMARRKRNGVK